MQNNKLETSDYIDLSKDWYYVQGLRDASKPGTRSDDVVVFAKNLKEAKQKTTSWAFDNNIGQLHFYRNTYKPDARRLVRNGKVIK